MGLSVLQIVQIVIYAINLHWRTGCVGIVMGTGFNQHSLQGSDAESNLTCATSYTSMLKIQAVKTTSFIIVNALQKIVLSYQGWRHKLWQTALISYNDASITFHHHDSCCSEISSLLIYYSCIIHCRIKTLWKGYCTIHPYGCGVGGRVDVIMQFGS